MIDLQNKTEPSAAIADALDLITDKLNELKRVIDSSLTEANEHACGLIDLSNAYADELEQAHAKIDDLKQGDPTLQADVKRLKDRAMTDFLTIQRLTTECSDLKEELNQITLEGKEAKSCFDIEHERLKAVLAAKEESSTSTTKQIEELEAQLIEFKVALTRETARLADATARQKKAVEFTKLQNQELKKLKALEPLKLAKKNKELKEHNSTLKARVAELEKKARDMTFTDDQGAGGLMSVSGHVKNALYRVYPRTEADRKKQNMMISRTGGTLADSLKCEVNRLREQLLAPAPLLNRYARSCWLHHFGKPYSGATEDSSWNVYVYESHIQSNVERAIKGLYFGVNIISSRGLCGLVIFGEYMEMGISISGSVAVLPEALIEDGYRFVTDMIKYTHPSIVQRANWMRTVSINEIGLLSKHCDLILDAGMPTLWHLMAAPIERIAMLNGIAKKTAEAIKVKAVQYLGDNWKKEVKLDPEITFIESVLQIAENCEIKAERQLEIALKIDKGTETPDERLIFDILVTNVNPRDFADMAMIEELEKAKAQLDEQKAKFDQEKMAALPVDITDINSAKA